MPQLQYSTIYLRIYIGPKCVLSWMQCRIASSAVDTVQNYLHIGPKSCSAVNTVQYSIEAYITYRIIAALWIQCNTTCQYSFCVIFQTIHLCYSTCQKALYALSAQSHKENCWFFAKQSRNWPRGITRISRNRMTPLILQSNQHLRNYRQSFQIVIT